MILASPQPVAMPLRIVPSHGLLGRLSLLVNALNQVPPAPAASGSTRSPGTQGRGVAFSAQCVIPRLSRLTG